MDYNDLDFAPRDADVIKAVMERKKRDRFQEYAQALERGEITPEQYQEFMRKQFNPWFMEKDQ